MGRSINPMWWLVSSKGRERRVLPPPAPIVSMSLQPVIPWRVALQHGPPPLHRLFPMLNNPVVDVNHHLTRGGEFSTGETGSFQSALTEASNPFRSPLYPPDWPSDKDARPGGRRQCPGHPP